MTKTQARSPKATRPRNRFEVWITDPNDHEDCHFAGTFTTRAAAENEATKREREGWQADITEITPADLIFNNFGHCNEALHQIKTQGHITKMRAAGWPESTVANYIAQAKQIGEAYGRTVGFRAQGWDELEAIDEHTHHYHTMQGVEPIVMDLAEEFAKRAFWQARNVANSQLTK